LASLKGHSSTLVSIGRQAVRRSHSQDKAKKRIMRKNETLNVEPTKTAAESELSGEPDSHLPAVPTPSPDAAEESNQRAEVERLQAERDQLFDRLARLQADFDNYALVNTVEQFLPVLDNFQLALRSQSTAEQLRSGVDLIVRQMEEILRNLGVQPVPTTEARFDPRLHEAIEMVERDDLPDQQVMDEVRRGYTLRDRLVRPALVRVANNPQQKTA
jgi:molecular chaperone GrpE